MIRFLLIGNIALLLSGVLTVSELLSCLINEGVLVMMATFVLGKALKRTRLLEDAMLCLVHRIENKDLILGGFLSVALIVSAVLSNTATFLIMEPVISNFCELHQLSNRRFLLPVSYATMLGGVLTMIGTTNNLVLNSLSEVRLSFFEIAVSSWFPVVLGYFYAWHVGKRLNFQVHYTVPRNSIEATLFRYKIIEKKTGYLYHAITADQIGHCNNPHSIEWNVEDRFVLTEDPLPDAEWRFITTLKQFRRWEKGLVVLGFLWFVISQVFLPPLLCALVAVAFCPLPMMDIFRSLNLPIFFLISLSLPAGIVIDKYDLLQFMERYIAGLHPYAAIHLIIFLSAVLAQTITNPCAAVVAFYTLKDQTLLPKKALLLSILLGTNTCFSNGLLYPTHILAQEKGKYGIGAFLRYGIVMDIMFGFISANMIYLTS